MGVEPTTHQLMNRAGTGLTFRATGLPELFCSSSGQVHACINSYLGPDCPPFTILIYNFRSKTDPGLVRPLKSSWP